MHRFLIAHAVFVIGLIGNTNAEVAAVSDDEARVWIRRVAPLPKSIAILGKVVAPPGEVAVVSPDARDPLIRQARRELRDSLRATQRRRASEKAAFKLTLQLGGPEAEELRKLKNSGQAYRILPEDDRALRLVALTPRGLYYAAKTLQQLIRARASRDAAVIPILRVTDWPDLEDRGLWGSDSHLNLKWLGDRKMNFVAQISYLEVDKAGRAHARLKDGREPMVSEGPLYGIEPAPIILHLEQIYKKGVFDAYPNLAAEGGQEGAICYSQPEIVDILADWMVDLGSLPHVETVDVWLTENLHRKGGCRCEECKKTDRSVLETRIVIAAWEKAKKRLPRVGLRILTSEETARSNKLIFRELPPQVKVWYYHSLLTYTSGETPIIHPDVAAFARKGRWVGVCPNLCAWVGQTLPFTSAQFVRYRIAEFVEKRLSGLLGYATPRIGCVRFNVEAAAEWSWNVKGRTPREFAASYAARAGMDDPERFADWAETIGPVAWDVYGSDWPVAEKRSIPPPVAQCLKTGTLPPLGTVRWGAFRGPWGDIKSLEQLDRDVARAAEAADIAREIGEPALIHESLVVQGFINSLKALYELSGLVKSGAVPAEKRDVAKRYFTMYVESLKQSATALPRWVDCVAPERDIKRPVAVSIKLIDAAREDMQRLAEELLEGTND